VIFLRDEDLVTLMKLIRSLHVSYACTTLMNECIPILLLSKLFAFFREGHCGNDVFL